MWDLAAGTCVHVFGPCSGGVESVCFSDDCRWALSGSSGNELHLWELDWENDFPKQADFDEKARPHLEVFLTLHRQRIEDGLRRAGAPNWNEADFMLLLEELKLRGFGWLRPDGVRRQLQRLSNDWRGESNT